MKARTRKYLTFTAVVLVAAGIDLGTKWAVDIALTGREEPWVIIPHFFQIVRVQNPGAVGQLLAGRIPVLISVTVVAMCAILWMLRRTPVAGRWETVALGLLFGGALGNLWDRARYGHVRDFLDFHVGEGPFRHYPTFNMADAALVVGAGMLILALWRAGSGHSAEPTGGM